MIAKGREWFDTNLILAGRHFGAKDLNFAGQQTPTPRVSMLDTGPGRCGCKMEQGTGRTLESQRTGGIGDRSFLDRSAQHSSCRSCGRLCPNTGISSRIRGLTC